MADLLPITLITIAMAGTVERRQSGDTNLLQPKVVLVVPPVPLAITMRRREGGDGRLLIWEDRVVVRGCITQDIHTDIMVFPTMQRRRRVSVIILWAQTFYPRPSAQEDMVVAEVDSQ